jgi:hypothetical protein
MTPLWTAERTAGKTANRAAGGLPKGASGNQTTAGANALSMRGPQWAISQVECGRGLWRIGPAASKFLATAFSLLFRWVISAATPARSAALPSPPQLGQAVRIRGET